ncbi:oxidoreductase [Actinoplanes sp. N902-109]|nr:oxidoreductase [Actinoplanes sp. N902-109]
MRYHEYGEPEVLTIEEADIPEPGPGQVLIRAEAIGANFVDTRFRRGPAGGAIFGRPLPGTLTGDVVGTVRQTGADVDTALLGRRVAALSEDAFADYAVADAAWATVVPDTMDVASASVLATAAPVALRVLRTGGLAPGETVLIHSAAGAIGHLCVQLATVLGAGAVIAVAGTAEKVDFALRHGATAGIASSTDWASQVSGVDLVVEAVGGGVLRRSLGVLGPYGRMVVFGAASGELVDIPVTELFALRSVAGFSLLAWRATRPAQARAEMTELTGLITAGRLRTSVHATLPLAEAAEAHRLLESRTTMGRVLLVP